MHNQWITAFLFNIILISTAQNLPLLTKKGWFHAGILGTILWGCIGWQGWLSVCAYLILGSLVTKIGFKDKELKGIAESRGGKRGPENVWGSSATGCFLAIVIKIFPEISELLMIGFCASFSAKLADTFGSEIGKHFGKNAFLITTLKRVKPGTDGAISVEGTLASFIGSLMMTIVMAKLSLISGNFIILLVVFSGLTASIIESYLGAILQNRISWITNEMINSLQTSIAAMLAILASYYFKLL